MIAVKERKESKNENRAQCDLRSKDGRCTPCIRRCGSMERRICDSLQYAYARGYKDAYMGRKEKEGSVTPRINPGA